MRLERYKFLLIFLFLSSVSPPSAYPGQITGSGCSVSNVGYLTELAKEYEKETGMKVFVRGGGSVAGLEDLGSGRVDFAASCRDKKKDDPKDIKFIKVAWDALVFIVHKSNTLDNISIEDVRAIYAGEITNWKELTGVNKPIKLFISRPRKGLSGVESSTKELVLKGKDPAEIPNAVTLASTGIVEQMIEKTLEGFATSGFSSARKRDVKILKVNGVYPDKKTISTDRYPFRRPLYIVVPKNPKPEVRRFVDFVLGKQGQQFISSRGMVSLLDKK